MDGMRTFLRLFRRYIRESKSGRRRSEGPPSVTDLTRYLIPWMLSQSEDRDPLADCVPWVTYAAAAEIGRSVDSSSRVFEYGTGGSTAYFARRVARVIGVEHDPDWAQRVIGQVGDSDNVEVLVVSPDQASSQTGQQPSIYRSLFPTLRDRTFQRYASAVDDYPDGSFDLLLIDGRARPGCFAHGQRKVRVGGRIVVDNSERPEYDAIREAALAGGWSGQHFFGPGPYNDYFWETTVWHKTGGLSETTMEQAFGEEYTRD